MRRREFIAGLGSAAESLCIDSPLRGWVMPTGAAIGTNLWPRRSVPITTLPQIFALAGGKTDCLVCAPNFDDMQAAVGARAFFLLGQIQMLSEPSGAYSKGV